MKYRGIFEYEYPTEHKTPVSIDVHLHGDCVKGKIIDWEYRPLEQEPRKGHWCPQNDDCFDWYECSECGYGSEGEMQYSSEYDVRTNFCPNCGADMREDEE